MGLGSGIRKKTYSGSTGKKTPAPDPENVANLAGCDEGVDRRVVPGAGEHGRHNPILHLTALVYCHPPGGDEHIRQLFRI
jgi:hypothetical protein